jgi:hypothetical protein
MAGLNNLLSDTQQTITTLPSWYDAAQQQIVNQGNQAASAAPQLGQTVAQGAINTLQPGAANPFTQAQGTLQQISTGAANPWITNASGNVTPNTSTAMGGLFKAQDQQLNQLLPTTLAPTEAAGVGTGGFGGLRAQTAVDTAKSNALATLQAQQMAAALQNQQTGQLAATNLGNVAGQGINAGMNVGLAQQNAPFQNVGNFASLLGTLQAPTTVNSQKQMSPLTQAATLANVLTGAPGVTSGLSSLLFGSPAVGTPGTPGYRPATSGILSGITGTAKSALDSLLNGSGSGIKVGSDGLPVPGTYPLSDGGTIVINPDQSQVITSKDGTVSNFDKDGHPTAPVLNPIPDTGLPQTPDTGNPDNPQPVPDYTPVIDVPE